MENNQQVIKRMINLSSQKEYAKLIIARYTDNPNLYIDNFEFLVLGYEQDQNTQSSKLSYVYVEKRGVRVKPSCDHECATCDSSCMHFLLGRDSYFISQEIIY